MATGSQASSQGAGARSALASASASAAINNKNRYGSQGKLSIGAALEMAPIKLTPSSSDYFRRPSQGQQNFQSSSAENSDRHNYNHNLNLSSASVNSITKSRQSLVQSLPAPTNMDRPVRKDSTRSVSRIMEKQHSADAKKREPLSQQSNSFDDFVRLSNNAGIDDRQLSPSKVQRSTKHRGLSVSASELVRRKGSESEEDIKKVVFFIFNKT